MTVIKNALESHAYTSSTESNMAPDLLSSEMRSVDLGPPVQQCFKLINEKEELQVWLKYTVLIVY